MGSEMCIRDSPLACGPGVRISWVGGVLQRLVEPACRPLHRCIQPGIATGLKAQALIQPPGPAALLDAQVAGQALAVGQVHDRVQQAATDPPALPLWQQGDIDNAHGACVLVHAQATDRGPGAVDDEEGGLGVMLVVMTALQLFLGQQERPALSVAPAGYGTCLLYTSPSPRDS